ncbi:MAG: hypothetical protein ACRDHI_04380 [Actinomycetota bacterium]
MTIGMTEATGGVGSGVIRHLLARPNPPPVVALARWLSSPEPPW